MIARYRPVILNYNSAEGPKFEGSFAPANPSLKNTLKVVSYNIRFGKAIEQVAEAFGRYETLTDADIVLLQEMDEIGTEAIARQLGYNYVYYPACRHNHHGRNFGNAILSRWPFLQTWKLVLPRLSPVTRQIRIATKASVQIGTQELLVYSTHTEVYLTSVSHRWQQIDTVISDIVHQVEESTAVIVGGDFNTVSNRGINRMGKQFAKVGLVRASKGAGPTMLRHVYRPTAADHIFVRGLKTLDRGAVREATASDHAPVWVELELKGSD